MKGLLSWLRASEPGESLRAEPQACPTQACSTCGYPLPVVAYDQSCPRCRALMPAAASCPGGCSGCEMGRAP